MIPTKYTCAKCGKPVKVEQKSPNITLVYPCECKAKIKMVSQHANKTWTAEI